MPANSIDDRETCKLQPPHALQPLPPGVSIGAQVLARGRRCRVDAAVPHHDCCEIHLGLPGRPRPQVLLWPFDRPVPLEGGRRFRAVRLRTWTRTVARFLRSELDPQTPRAVPDDVHVVPYQLAPALAVARGVSRVLLADEVGLGKTIQAGWIVADIVAREPAARVLLAVPASVRRQWIGELDGRFGIAAAEVHARWLRRMVADLPADVSPWAPPGVYVASLDFLKRPDVASSIARHVWDALVVDEAHTATAPTERHAALSLIAKRTRRIILITATPYSGDPASFGSMTTLGAVSEERPPIMFRRFREDVGDPRRRRHRFATVRLTAPERRLQRLLERYSRAVWHEAPEDVSGARLAVTILRKRALSSPAAAARSLRRRFELLASRTPAPRQLALFDDEDVIDDDLSSAALGVRGLADAALEERWLADLIEASESAAGHDSKLLYVRRLLRRLQHESVVIFTEYRDTLLYLADLLPPSLQLHGGLSATERCDVQARFNHDGGLLLATDAAAEGLNLHGRCRTVINYELPWNPARLEQRIGRVDRIGQPRTVHAVSITTRDPAEQIVIANLARRLTRVVAALGPRDRLGAFLDDARIARVVIGGASLIETDSVGADALATREFIERAPATLDDETNAAERIQRAMTLPEQSWGGEEVTVASLRADRLVDRGILVIHRCAAQTVDGVAAARTLVALRVQCCPSKPRSALHARTIAREAAHVTADPMSFDPLLTVWLVDARRYHEGAVDAALARETALQGQAAAHCEVQPGLFDKRAIELAERETQAEGVIEDEHARRIAALQRSRELQIVCAPVAVLIAWC